MGLWWRQGVFREPCVCKCDGLDLRIECFVTQHRCPGGTGTLDGSPHLAIQHGRMAWHGCMGIWGDEVACTRSEGGLHRWPWAKDGESLGWGVLIVWG